MILVLTNGERVSFEKDDFSVVNDYKVIIGILTNRGVETGNQIGLRSEMSINHNCDPLEALKRNSDSEFFLIGKKTIPVRNVCYIEEV